MADVRKEWVRLLVDEDGAPIRIGDVMRFGSVERDLTVLGFGVPDDIGGEYGVYVLDGDDYTWYNASYLRHHRAPTVEDVLREFGKAWVEWEDGAAMMNPVETFASKLRLAEGEGA